MDDATRRRRQGRGCATPSQPTRRILRELIERHLRFTGSTRALAILDNWEAVARQVS